MKDRSPKCFTMHRYMPSSMGWPDFTHSILIKECVLQHFILSLLSLSSSYPVSLSKESNWNTPFFTVKKNQREWACKERALQSVFTTWGTVGTSTLLVPCPWAHRSHTFLVNWPMCFSFTSFSPWTKIGDGEDICEWWGSICSYKTP